MATTYTWSFTDADCTLDGAGVPNGCVAIHWRRRADDGAGNIAEVYGSASYGGSFTTIAALTQAGVEGWAEAALDVAEIDARLDAQLAELETPTRATIALELS